MLPLQEPTVDRMNWIKVSLQAEGLDTEILLAWACEMDFDAFEQSGNQLFAYVPASRFDENKFREAVEQFPFQSTLVWAAEKIEDKNWNEAWEKSYEPVRIENRVTIRAPFHSPAPSGDIDLLIEPKMSFGTGHHPTTTLMVRLMLQEEWQDSTVLDLGCGSGVLGLLAARLGAAWVVGIDIDDWAVENTIENCQRNHVTNMRVEKGDARAIGNRRFTRVLANINRNILVKELPALYAAMEPGARLFLSGFLQQDISLIREAATAAGLDHLTSVIENEWAAVSFRKS